MHKTILLGTAIALSPLSAMAAVQTIPLNDATRGIAPTINVCPGIGYNLSFLEMQGGVAWAKIDDPSQVHVSFETRDLTKSPAKLIHLQRIEQLNFRGIPKSKSTLLTVFTTSRKLLRFKVAYTCPNRFDTGIVEGAIAQRPRTRRQVKPSPRQADPVIPKPKARVSSLVQEMPQLTFANQFVIDGNVDNFYGLPSTPESEETEDPPLEEDIWEVPPPPTEKDFAYKDTQVNIPIPTPRPIEIPVPNPQSVSTTNVEISPSKVAWHLTRGLHQARLRKEINYNTSTYRQWQSVIARVRRGQSLEDAISSVGTSIKVGAVLLKYGGLQ